MNSDISSRSSEENEEDSLLSSNAFSSRETKDVSMQFPTPQNLKDSSPQDSKEDSELSKVEGGLLRSSKTEDSKSRPQHSTSGSDDTEDNLSESDHLSDTSSDDNKRKSRYSEIGRLVDLDSEGTPIQQGPDFKKHKPTPANIGLALTPDSKEGKTDSVQYGTPISEDTGNREKQLTEIGPKDNGQRSSLAGRLLSTDDGAGSPMSDSESIVQRTTRKVSFATESHYIIETSVLPGECYADDGSGTPSKSSIQSRIITPGPKKKRNRQSAVNDGQISEMNSTTPATVLRSGRVSIKPKHLRDDS